VKKFFKSFGRFFGYSVFFIGALILFIYMTLPVEEARAFLVRKASDEYNADLVFADKDSLGVCGLACVEAQNVTFTIRPSAEELAAFQEEQRVWKEWKEAEAGVKAPADAPTTEEGAAAPDSAGPDTAAADPAAADPAAADPAAADPAAPMTAGDAPPAVIPKTTSVAKPAAAAQAPKKPEWPAQPIELASLRAELAPIKFMRGLLEGRLQAQLLGGTLDAEVSQTAEEMHIKGTLADLDVAQLPVLKRLVPLPIAGVVSIDLDLTVELDDQKKPKFDLITGTANIHVKGAFVGPGQIESKKLGAFPYFDVPRTRIEDLGGRLVFEKRRATFEDFAIRGPDIEGDITGYIQLAADVGRWGPRAHLRFKFSDTFLEAHKDVKTAMTNIAYLKNGQKDGYTGFAVTGEFGKLKWTPRKDSPYKARERETRPTAGGDEQADEAADTKRPTAVDRVSKGKPDRPVRRPLDKARSEPPFAGDQPSGGLDRPGVSAGRKPYIRPPSTLTDMPIEAPPEEPTEEPEEEVAVPSPTEAPETEEPTGAGGEEPAPEAPTEEPHEGVEEAP